MNTKRVLGLQLSTVIYLVFTVGVLLAISFFCQTIVKGTTRQVALGGLALVVSLWGCANGHDRLHVPAAMVALLLFYAWVVMDQNMAFRNGLTSTMCFVWILLFGGTLFNVLLLGNAGEKRQWETSFWDIMVVIGVFYAVITIICWIVPAFHDAIFNRFFAGPTATLDAADWKAGFTNHYSTNGIYLALGLIACVPLLLDKRRGVVRRFLPFAVILFALLLTTKRAHFVFGIASIAFALVLYGSREKLSTAFKAIIIAAIALICLYLASLYVPDLLGVFDRLLQLQHEDYSTDDRTLFVNLCRELWQQSPIAGHGMGFYAISFNMTGVGSRYISQGYGIMYAHNCYWQVLAEEGMIGFALFIIMLAISVIGTIRLLLKLNKFDSNNESDRMSLAASIALQLFFILYCTTGNPLYDMQTYIPYLLSVGVYLMVRNRFMVDGVLAVREFRGKRGTLPINSTAYEARRQSPHVSAGNSVDWKC